MWETGRPIKQASSDKKIRRCRDGRLAIAALRSAVSQAFMLLRIRCAGPRGSFMIVTTQSVGISEPTRSLSVAIVHSLKYTFDTNALSK